MDNLLFALTILVILVIYLPVGYLFFQQSRKKSTRQRFFKAANAILQRNPDDRGCSVEFMLAYKKTVQFNQGNTIPYKNAADFIEEMIYAIDTLDSDKFKSAYGFIKTEEMHRRLWNILNILKQNQPYASVSGKHAGLLDSINKAMEGENVELGKMSLHQLTDSISALENAHHYQSQVNTVTITTSIASLFLVLVLAVTLLIR